MARSALLQIVENQRSVFKSWMATLLVPGIVTIWLFWYANLVWVAVFNTIYYLVKQVLTLSETVDRTDHLLKITEKNALVFEGNRWVGKVSGLWPDFYKEV